MCGQLGLDGVLALVQPADPVVTAVVADAGSGHSLEAEGMLPFAFVLQDHQDWPHACSHTAIVVANHAADRTAALQAYIRAHGRALHDDLLGLGFSPADCAVFVSKHIFGRERRKIAFELGDDVIGSGRNLGHLKAAVERGDGSESSALLHQSHAL